MFFKQKVVLAKLETIYGTDASPVGADAILTKSLSVMPYQGSTITRDLDRETYGAQLSVNTNPYVEITFDVELAGSGTAGTAPAYAKLLLASGFKETIAASVSATYTPVSDNFKSVTLWYMQRNDAGGFQAQKVTGARGSVSFTVDRAGIPVMRFKFIGFYNRPADMATITVNTSAFIDPVYVSKANTVFKIGTVAMKASAFSLDVANNLVPRQVTGHQSVEITDRNPTGSVTADAPALSTLDLFSKVESHNGIQTQSVTLTHGVLAGNIVELVGARVQLTSLSPTDVDGVLAYQMGMTFVPLIGNDELTLTIK